MLPIVGKDVEGKKVSIFNQNVQSKHPLLGLKFKNTSGAHLNQGPITVFEGSVYAGDTRILDVQPNEERLVSYAIDLGTEVDAQVGPGTPMGSLLRYYWYPVCAADELLKSPFRTKEVTILGEELVIYRDRSGQLGCTDKYCTHRRAFLAYGVVEEHGIRCQYHGWKFDETGACIEQPFEDTTHPEDNFRSKCGIRGDSGLLLAACASSAKAMEPMPTLAFRRKWRRVWWRVKASRGFIIVSIPNGRGAALRESFGSRTNADKTNPRWSAIRRSRVIRGRS